MPSSFRGASTSVSSASGAIICNIARAAFGAAESMSRKSRSKKQPENRGRKRHAKFFGGGAAGHRGGRVQRARTHANHRPTAKGSDIGQASCRERVWQYG